MITKTSTPDGNRWFIWTIVFLLASGISLVSYIMISDIDQSTQLDNTDLVVRHRS